MASGLDPIHPRVEKPTLANRLAFGGDKFVQVLLMGWHVLTWLRDGFGIVFKFDKGLPLDHVWLFYTEVAYELFPRQN